MGTQAVEDTRIRAEGATRIRVEAIRAGGVTQVGEVTRGVAHTLAAATAVVDEAIMATVEEATMAVAEEATTVGAVTAGITAGAALD